MTQTKYCTFTKQKVIDEYVNGQSQIDISRKFSINKSTISRWIRKYNESGTIISLHKGGRPRKTTTRTDAAIVREFKKRPFMTPTEVVNNLQLQICPRTVSRRAKEGGLFARRSAKKPLISQKNRLEYNLPGSIYIGPKQDGEQSCFQINANLI